MLGRRGLFGGIGAIPAVTIQGTKSCRGVKLHAVLSFLSKIRAGLKVDSANEGCTAPEARNFFLLFFLAFLVDFGSKFTRLRLFKCVPDSYRGHIH